MKSGIYATLKYLIAGILLFSLAACGTSQTVLEPEATSDVAAELSEAVDESAQSQEIVSESSLTLDEEDPVPDTIECVA